MRQPAVADRFYPGSPQTLAHEIHKLMPAALNQDKKKALAVVSPHAGYMYSGTLAAATFSSIEIPETVIIIGPNHRGHGGPIALSTTSWEMPFGSIAIDNQVCDLILAHCQHAAVDEQAHKHEHSLEVQLPFLQMLQKKLHIVPIVVSHIPYSLCEELGNAIFEAVKICAKDILIVASSDMSHYEPRKKAEKMDRMALQCLDQMNPSALYHTVIDNQISMCGFIPVVIALIAAKKQGGNNCSLIGYTDSGYASGDTNQVVGYAGVVIN
jgi:MEMO1 family protein